MPLNNFRCRAPNAHSFFMPHTRSNLTDSVLHIFSQYIAAGATIVVGVSGGPDSTALLHLLVGFSKKTSCRIIIAHVNHGLRGKAADRDENFVKKLAARYGLTYEVKRVTLKGKTRLEEQGRVARKTFFEALQKKFSAQWILTAHTRDDHVGTILFNFFRGSGPAGLAGMNVVSGAYLKPLRDVTKTELLAYLKSEKLKFCVDATNSDSRFTRNFIRTKILPLILKVNPSLAETLTRNAAIFDELDIWLREEAQKFLGQHIGKPSRNASAMSSEKSHILFPLNAFESLPKALKMAVIQEAYKSAMGAHYALPLVKVQEILRMLSRRIGNKKIVCGGGGTCMLKSGLIFFSS